MAEIRRILVAEDSDTTRAQLVGHLRAVGYEVLGFADGRGVIAELQRAPASLVVLDVMMPGLDGYETLRMLRHTYDSATLPVIMLTSRGSGEDVIQALRLGANDYAVKPVDYSVLAGRIATHLSLASSKNVRLGDYQLVRRLASGSMGIVHEAIHTKTGRPAAVKVLPRSLTVEPTSVKRFMREAALVSRVTHPNVVRLYEAGQDGETYFIAMELVQGRDLFSLSSGRPTPPSLVVDAGLQLCRALECLQSHGIIHRDVKPHNALVAPDGTVKLTDFGIARDVGVEHEITRPGLAVGSLSYASVEQMCGTTDFRSDIYSLGSTLYFLCTGRPPFPAKAPLPELLEMKMGPPPSARAEVPEVPESLDRVLRLMMAAKPAARPQTYEELIKRFEEIDAELGDQSGSTLRDWYVSRADSAKTTG